MKKKLPENKDELTSILETIDKVFSELKKPSTAQGILKCASILSTVMYNLGALYAQAYEEANVSERVYKEKIDDRVLEMRMSSDKTVAEIEARARLDAKELIHEWLVKDALSNKLRTIRTDVDRKISVIQSYASELRSQKTYRANTQQ